jgi:hypothetical protein
MITAFAAMTSPSSKVTRCNPASEDSEIAFMVRIGSVIALITEFLEERYAGFIQAT